MKGHSEWAWGGPGRRWVCPPAPCRSGSWTLLKKKGLDSSGSCVRALTLSPRTPSIQGGVQTLLTPLLSVLPLKPEGPGAADTGSRWAHTRTQTPTCFGQGLLYVDEPEFPRVAAHHGAQMWTARWPHLHPTMCTTAGPLGTENLLSPASPAAPPHLAIDSIRPGPEQTLAWKAR